MKYKITIPALLVVVSVGFGQTSDIKTAEHTLMIPTTINSPTLLASTAVDDYKPTIYGSIDSVWRHVNPVFQGLTFPSLFSTSDDNFYLFGFSGKGGTLSKMNPNGTVEWMLDRYEHKDNGNKLLGSFERFSELQNGNILIYGGVGNPGMFISGYAPNKMLLMPNGTIIEEKDTRDLINTLGVYVYGRPFYPNVTPVEMLIFRGLEYDSILAFYSMDLELKEIRKELRIQTEMTEFSTGPELLPYKDGTFIIAIQGKSIEQPIFHIAFLQYNNDYSFVKKTIVPTNGASKFVVVDNYSVMIASSITTSNSKPLHLRKIDQNGNQLWEQVVDGLQDIPLKVNGLSTTRDGGFIVTGETWLRKSDGSVDYDNETRIGFITKLSSEGEMQWYYTTGRAGMWNRIFCVAEASNGDFVTVCNSGNTSSKVNYEETMEIVRLRPKAMSVNEDTRRLENNLTISPNPANTRFTISGIDNISSVKIMNSLGMEMSRNPVVVSGKQEIDVSDLSSGIYFVQMRTTTGMMTKPIVVQR